MAEPRKSAARLAVMLRDRVADAGFEVKVMPSGERDYDDTLRFTQRGRDTSFEVQVGATRACVKHLGGGPRGALDSTGYLPLGGNGYVEVADLAAKMVALGRLPPEAPRGPG